MLNCTILLSSLEVPVLPTNSENLVHTAMTNKESVLEELKSYDPHTVDEIDIDDLDSDDEYEDVDDDDFGEDQLVEDDEME